MKESHTSEHSEKSFDRELGQFTKIDRKASEIFLALDDAPVYKKSATVLARPAIPGEEVVTMLKDGSEETGSVANVGDMVVTNPFGEQYPLSADMFASRYDTTAKDGVYTAKGFIKAIKNPYGVPIEILASWGTPQYGDEECFIADVCDSDGNNQACEPYIIEAEAFNETFQQENHIIS